MSKELVIARYNEDTIWIKDIKTKNVNITMYNKGNPIPNSIELPNVGREGHTYLHHILRNWDNLADLTAFVQGKRPSFGYLNGHLCSSVKIDDYLEKETMIYTCSITPCERFTRTRSSYLNEIKIPRPVSSLPSGAEDDCWSEFTWFEWSNESFKQLKEKQFVNGKFFKFFDFVKEVLGISLEKQHHVNFAQGAQFSVSRNSIQAYPKSFYQELLKYLDHSVCPYEVVFLEWSWGLIFENNKNPVA